MKTLLANHQGQGIMEYVIISSLVGICCLIAVKQFGAVIQKRIENMKSQIAHEIDLKSIK
jgi:hypothetical protein